MNQFYCPLCGDRACIAFGAVCETCRIQAGSTRGSNSEGRTFGVCFYCRASHLVVEDHVVPVARGGPEVGWNRVKTCDVCNNNKSDKLPSEWCPTHEEALAIECRVPVIFPRMRHGYIILGGDRATRYANMRALCTNFKEALSVERSGLPTGDKAVKKAISLHFAVDKLRLFLDDQINIAEAKGENEDAH